MHIKSKKSLVLTNATSVHVYVSLVYVCICIQYEWTFTVQENVHEMHIDSAVVVPHIHDGGLRNLKRECMGSWMVCEIVSELFEC